MLILAAIALLTIYIIATSSAPASKPEHCYLKKEPHAWTYRESDDAMVCAKCGMTPSYQARGDNE